MLWSELRKQLFYLEDAATDVGAGADNANQEYVDN